MFNKKVPCHNCEKRHVGCHGHCQEYLSFRKALDEFTEQKREEERVSFLSWENRSKRRFSDE